MSRTSALAVGAGAAALGAYSLWQYHRNKNIGPFLSPYKWFSELGPLWPGQAFSLRVKRLLHRSTSQYQDVLVFESTQHGKVLVLDGAIQCTELDEFAYQEMMAHVPLMSHANPRHVLIVGGGDGGVAREVAKHQSVERIDLCEIDSRVVEVSREHLQHMSCGLDDERVFVHIQDGAEFLETREGEYDVVIIDSSDPGGPADSLFNEKFYKLVHRCLKEDGIFAAQGECVWLDLDLIRRLRERASIFTHVSYANISIPTYPCGCIGVLLGSKSRDPRTPARTDDELHGKTPGLRYYTPEIHAASQVHPRFCSRIFQN